MNSLFHIKDKRHFYCRPFFIDIDIASKFETKIHFLLESFSINIQCVLCYLTDVFYFKYEICRYFEDIERTERVQIN